MLGHCSEDAGWQRHVEDTVGFFPSLLKFLEVFPQLDKRLVLIVLPRNICAELTELLQLLLHVLCWCLYVRLDPLEEFLVVHFCSGISDNFNVLWQELVAKLSGRLSAIVLSMTHSRARLTRPKRAGNYSKSDC